MTTPPRYMVLTGMGEEFIADDPAAYSMEPAETADAVNDIIYDAYRMGADVSVVFELQRETGPEGQRWYAALKEPPMRSGPPKQWSPRRKP